MKNLMLLLLIVSCAQKPEKSNSSANVVLVGDLHLGSDAWKLTQRYLTAAKFNFVELGRLGRDNKEPSSLSNIAQESCKIIPQKSFLVAHGFGGAIANQMAGVCPEKIAKIIYLAAIVPLEGEHPFDLMSKIDKDSYARIVTAGRFKIIPKEANTFYRRIDLTISEKVLLPSLYSEWATLDAEIINYDEARFAAIPKVYLYAERDRFLGLTTQFQYTSRSGIENTEALPNGHFPMLSNPERLAKYLIKWVH